jgi:predicted Zn-dependent peptidase
VYQVSRLPNGLTIATAEMRHMKSVAVGLWVGVGGRYEPMEISGVAHFIEHLLFKGTKRRTAAGISAAVEGVGGYLNAFTSEENTCFHARAQAECLPQLLDVLVDMVLHSRFAPADVARERDVIKEEIAMYRDQPHQLVHELLHETLWPEHPLGRPLTGTERTLDATRRTELLCFLGANYVAPNTILAVAGPQNHREVARAFAKFARTFPAGRKPAFTPATTQQTAPALRFHSKNTEQTQLAIGIRALSRHDDRRHALRVLNAILGENMSSRLFQLLREDKGLAYSIYSSWAFMEDTGALTISAGMDADDLLQATRLIVRETRRFTETPPSPAELRRAREYIIGQMELNLESTESQMNWLGESLLGYGKIVLPREAKDRVKAVTASEVRGVARDLFRPERLSVAVISPLEKDPGLAKLLRW